MGDRRPRRRSVVGSSLLLVLLLPVAVAASQVVYRDVTLERAATVADTILVATHLSTAVEHGTVYRFRVERVLVGVGVAAPEEIRVRMAHYTEWTRAMRLAEAGGTRRSPLVERLPSPPAVDLRPTGRYCLLLERRSVDPDAFELAVADGHLGEAACPRAAALHAAPASPPGG